MRMTIENRVTDKANIDTPTKAPMRTSFKRRAEI